MERVVFTTPVAITPHAILAATNLVIPTYRPAFSPNAAFEYAYAAPFFVTYFAAEAKVIASTEANTAAHKYIQGAKLPDNFATLPGDRNIPVPIIEFIVSSTIDQNFIFFFSDILYHPFFCFIY